MESGWGAGIVRITFVAFILMAISFSVVTFVDRGGAISSYMSTASTSNPGREDFRKLADVIQKYVRQCYVYGSGESYTCRQALAVINQSEFGRWADELIAGNMLRDDRIVLRNPDDFSAKVTSVTPFDYKGHKVYGGFIEFTAHLQDRANERYVDKCETLSFVDDVEFDKNWDFDMGHCASTAPANRVWHDRS